jgi:cellulose synthase/poly-beta-1,6-N-acetylglucosamine synthase-like glycosyltransferase
MTPLLLAAMIVFVLVLAHAAVLNSWRTAIERAQGAALSDAPPGDVAITVVVPARNAAATLSQLLQDIYAQQYPRERLEVIVVDDHSEDGTVAVVRAMMSRWPQLRLVILEKEEGKKDAITEAVRQATGELLLMTDADARCGPHRLRAFASHLAASANDMTLMPVHTSGRGPLAALQEEEQFAFMGAAAGSAMEGSALLANGANMAFTKKAFERVNGYAGDAWASGDDLFLLARMKKAGLKIGYLLDPEVVVRVDAETTWADFFAQRLRWAGKMRGLAGAGAFAGAIAVLLPYCIAAITAWAVIDVHFGQGMERTWLLLLAAWMGWAFPIVALINAAKRSIGTRRSSLRSLFALVCFPIYSLPIALTSLFIRPKWKGRRV